MQPDEYQQAAIATAIYPASSSGIGKHNPFYSALGLIGEALEAEASPGDIDELGDVLWYVATLSNELGFKLSEIIHLGQERSRYQGMRGGSLLYLAAEVAEPMKKLWRDGSDLKKDLAIKDCLADMMVLIEAMANAHPHIGGLAAVCDRNLAKLASRKDRGVLSGDGSSR